MERCKFFSLENNDYLIIFYCIAISSFKDTVNFTDENIKIFQMKFQLKVINYVILIARNKNIL